ncbi:hypothetical protein ASA1KI_43500 [Opitutales bacterium ASA1]|jgi:hypothetical protein|uniref:hypothetical protein n=1 Tax=Congregicoccus parvus TaxID=3081749 RepID=UPI002B2E5B0E|nr:hypothetical protein ASA1KI_43500 [Opitutales bacterium ASA1]
MSEYRPIIMRSNRLLGAALVEANLIGVEELEAANEKLLQNLDQAADREICLLHVLLNDTQVLAEQQVLEYMVEEMSLGLVDPRELDLNDDLKLRLETGLCWATWTVPFDRDGDIHYLASAYAMSPAVRQHWEKHLGGTIVWYGSTLACIGDFLEKLESERAGIAGTAVAS